MKSPACSRELAENYFERYHTEGAYLMQALIDSKPGDKIGWPRIRAARLKRIWLDFGKTGVVRDEKGLEDIADQMLNCIVRLRASTELLGHTNRNPDDVADAFGFELTPELNTKMDSFFRDAMGAWTLSDYGVDTLETLAEKLLLQDEAEQKVYILDRMLNVIHSRSDLAGLLVEGGSQTLSEIAAQGGYTTSNKY